LQETFPNDLKVVYKQHPLGNHYWATVAAEGAFAAGDQGKFFEYDEHVFGIQKEITSRLQKKAAEMGRQSGDIRSEDIQREVFIDIAGEIELDQGRFRQALESRQFLRRVQAEAAEALQVGARGTPASFLNGRYISGAKPFDFFRAEVQKELDWEANGNRPNFPAGKNVAELQPASSQGPDPNKVYPLQAGDAPFEGPANAKVTLLHYLDYQ